MNKLVKDNRYRVQFFPQGGKKPHEFVGQYMGSDNRVGLRDDHYFNLRPAAGTMIIQTEQVIATHQTEEPIRKPKRL